MRLTLLLNMGHGFNHGINENKKPTVETAGYILNKSVEIGVSHSYRECKENLLN